MAAAPSGLGNAFGLFTRGRRSFVALTPGYMLSPLWGSFIAETWFLE